ncbi:hypothetical protein ACH3XW_16750 [Acanthocheilonema viteae]
MRSIGPTAHKVSQSLHVTKYEETTEDKAVLSDKQHSIFDVSPRHRVIRDAGLNLKVSDSEYVYYDGTTSAQHIKAGCDMNFI